MQLGHQKQQKTQVQCTTDIVSSWREKEAVAEEQYLNGPRMPVLPAELQTEHTLEFLWDELEVFLVYFHTFFSVTLIFKISFEHRRDFCLAAAKAATSKNVTENSGRNVENWAVVAEGEVARRLLREARHLANLLPLMSKEMQVSRFSESFKCDN